MKSFVIISILLAAAQLDAADPKPVYKLDKPELEARIAADIAATIRHRQGLLEVIRFMDTRPDLFSAAGAKSTSLMGREQKALVWSTWERFLDYQLALASLESYYAEFYRVRRPSREQAFLVGHAAFLARYRSALDFITRAERDPGLDKILNDAVPEIGLPAGSYAGLKSKNLNVAIASQFAARDTVLKTFSRRGDPALREAIAADTARLWAVGKGHGELLTAANALKVLRNGAESAWFPVQTGVAEWMGDTKVYRTKLSLVSPSDIESLRPKLRPGDILLERREWFLSNIGLPGFWPHAALYIGTSTERRAFFDDPEVRSWVRKEGEPNGDFEALLRDRYPSAWNQSVRQMEAGHSVRLLEAMSEGVSFTTLEHSAACDSLAVLRPRLSKAIMASAVLRAFHYAGRPYDFNFDFATDAELVCTELVCKAYAASGAMEGLSFPLTEMLGRQVTPANEMVRQFDEECGSATQQTDLVLFLDGHERAKMAVASSVEEFRQSWRRPKWHVLTQKAPPN